MNDDGELIDRCAQIHDKIDDHNDICELMSEYFIAYQRRYLLKAKRYIEHCFLFYNDLNMLMNLR